MIFVSVSKLNLNLMKAKIVPIIAVFSLLLFFFSSCEDTKVREYTGYAPVYMSYKDLRSSVAEAQEASLKNPGKIYYKDNYIFIVEELKGIHVFDNSDPSSPVKKSFVKIPGVIDMSVSGYIMYADSYVDLVVLDVQDIDNIHEVGRIKDVIPYTVPPAETDYPLGSIDKDKGVVIGWELRTIKEKVNNISNPYPIYYYKTGFFLDGALSSNSSSGVSGSGVGIGGSMARFGVKGKTLYVVNGNSLQVFDINSKIAPVKISELYPGWNVETMFLTEKNMFLGTTTGMVIYDISNPMSPVSQSFFRHARSCDPVVVDDTLAYVTLRTGTNCGGNQNILDVVNIKNINLPVLVKTYGLTNPHGLGKDGDLLFICDGTAGLKVYDASDPKNLANNLIYSYPGIKAFDVIPIGNILVLIGDDGLFQYNYSDVKNITLLGSILVEK
jgi:hypothetical protein